MPKILIVAAYFSPSGRIGARRPERFARHLNSRGWDVTVLTLRPKYLHPIDPSHTKQMDFAVLRTHAFMPGNLIRRATARGRNLVIPPPPASGSGTANQPASDRSSPALLRGLGRRLDSLMSSWEFPDRWIGWRRPALKAVRGMEFDLVLATTPPYTSVVIGREIASRSGAVLVPDYRDPWSEAPRLSDGPNPFQRHRHRHQALEDAALRQAGLALGASRTICNQLEARGTTRALYIPNSIDPSPAEKTSDGRHDVAYIGSLAYGRSLAPVLEGLRCMNGMPGAPQARLTYAGGDGPRAASEAREQGLENLLDLRGWLSQEEARRLVHSSRVAVVITTPGYEYNIPAKLVEYLAIGTPLLLVAPAKAEMADLFRRHTLGGHFTPEDTQGIAAFLLKALRGQVPPPQIPQEFDSEYVMDRLDVALRGLIQTA